MKNRIVTMEKYDLTKKSGYDKAIALLETSCIITSPLLFVSYKVAKWIFDSNSAEKQGKIAEDLIIVGKERGVDEMEITLDNKKGFHFNAPIDESVKIETVLGLMKKLEYE